MNKVAYKVLQQKALQRAAGFLDNYTLADAGIGALTGAGTYVLSGLLPKAEKKRKQRIIASLLTGSTAAAFGPQIRQYAADHSGVTEARLKRELAEARKRLAEYESPLSIATRRLMTPAPVEDTRSLWDRITDKLSDTLYGSKERSKLNADIQKIQEQLLKLQQKTRG